MCNQAYFRALMAAVFAVGVVGCGGGGDSGQSSFTPGDSGGGGGGDMTPSIALGVLTGEEFESGVIDVGVPLLAAGGSSGLSFSVVDTANDNSVVTDPVTASFTSECVRQNLATIDPNPATSINGAVSATYVAQGCSISDVITATATLDGELLSASGTVQVQAADVGSIEFVSATPTNIGIRGIGRQETSVVVFRVRDASGGTVPNQVVSFSLNTNVGDIRLTPVSGTTNGTGLVQTVVTAGTVATPVRVTASTSQNGRLITSQSEQLTITTGIPDQNSFSLSAESLNVEGLNRENTQVRINLLAADRYNNPVPDGTAVTFRTEGGSIDGSCVTEGGGCSVIWRSQDPRVGRSTVTAFAIGEESFDDADGDGLYDVSSLGEATDENGNGVLDPGERYGDISEAFADWNENGLRDDGTAGNGVSDPSIPVEPFIDFAPPGDSVGSLGMFDGPDGKFNGLLCDNRTSSSQGRPPPTADILCPLPRTRNVSDSVVIVMSGSSPEIDAVGDIAVTGVGVVYDAASRTITMPSGSTATISVVVRDVNNQPMAVGTTVQFSVDGGGNLLGRSSFTVPNTTDDSRVGNTFTVTYRAAELDPGEGNGSSVLELNVTSPSELVTSVSLLITTVAPPAVIIAP